MDGASSSNGTPQPENKHNLDELKKNSSLGVPEKSIVAQHYERQYEKEADEKDNSIVGILVGFVRWFFDSVQVIVIALAIFIVFYLFIVSPHTIDGVSMQPNFCNGDLILADKLSPRFDGYQHSDVIVFKHDEANDYIKRIIGKGGDKIKVENSKVYRNGQLLEEPYLPDGRVTLVQPGDGLVEGEEYTVPEGKYMVFGDNRPNSTDSRRFLAIDPNVNTIKGRVVVVMWPLNRARIFEASTAKPVSECSL